MIALIKEDWRSKLTLNAGMSDMKKLVFVTAIKKGDTDNVARMLNDEEVGVNDSYNSEGSSALMIASAHRQCSVVGLLLEKGAWVEHLDQDGWSALIRASKEGHCEVVELLCGVGGSAGQVDLQNSKGESAIWWASLRGHLEVVTLLLKRGARADLQSKNGWSALMCAGKEGHCEVVRLCRLTY